jgi:hypothetical protein
MTLASFLTTATLWGRGSNYPTDDRRPMTDGRRPTTDASRFRSSDEELAGIESLAGVTSGVLLRLTPTDPSVFTRIARESAGCYLVGFEPKPKERNGSQHGVEVDVRRSSTRVEGVLRKSAS